MESLSRHLDFERWRLLARNDPQAFEQQRRELLEAAIARASHHRQPRLRGLQWRIDRVRGRAANPLAACITLSGMMWEAFAGSNGLAAALRGERQAPLRPEQGRRGRENVHYLRNR